MQLINLTICFRVVFCAIFAGEIDKMCVCKYGRRNRNQAQTSRIKACRMPVRCNARQGTLVQGNEGSDTAVRVGYARQLQGPSLLS